MNYLRRKLEIMQPNPYTGVALSLCGLILLLLKAPVLSAPAKTEASSNSPSQPVYAAAKFKVSDVVGDWKSEWGPVHFDQDKAGTFNGSWKEGAAKIGKISDGKFSPVDGKLNFNFLETWTGLKGTAQLRLSDDRLRLAGRWVRGKDKGEWTMHRPIQGK